MTLQGLGLGDERGAHVLGTVAFFTEQAQRTLGASLLRCRVGPQRPLEGQFIARGPGEQALNPGMLETMRPKARGRDSVPPAWRSGNE